MKSEKTTGTEIIRKLGLLIAFGLFEMSIFFVGVTYAPALSIRSVNTAQIVLMVIFLSTALYLRANEKGRKFWEIPFSLFIASAATFVQFNYGDVILRLSRQSITTPAGIAIAKFSGSIWQIAVIGVLILVSGNSLRSIFLNRGRIGLGLAVGGIGFGVFAIMSYLPVLKTGIAAEEILSWTPWVLIFVLTNGFTEELLYRGLFLRRLEPFLGKHLSNLILAIVFTLMHLQVNYTADIAQFLLTVFPLALAWGYLMQKTDSIWGSAIFHAGADLMLIVGYFAML